MENKAGQKLAGYMFGRIFHYCQDSIVDMRNSFFGPREMRSPLDFRLPWFWWSVYAAVAISVWIFWPESISIPNDVWIGVLSFEGLLAALLASVGPAASFQGIAPSLVAFWTALDANLGEKLAEGIRRWREDPTQTTNLGVFRNAFLVAYYSLFTLPLIVVLDSRKAAAILVISLVWTARRTLSDAFPFFLPDATLLPRIYWMVRSNHESLSHCPICNGKPCSVDWPPAPKGNQIQGSPAA